MMNKQNFSFKNEIINATQKRCEIGSEFWDVPVSTENNCVFSVDTRWFLSGRSALECIIAEIKKNHDIKTAALPAWCCDSMIKPFVDAGVEVRFYPVYYNGECCVQDIANAEKCDVVFLMDYFGYTGFGTSMEHKIIYIRDVTHSIFSVDYTDAQYCFGSLRKWAGFYTGGFAKGVGCLELPENPEYVKLRSAAMEQKRRYIDKISSNKEYLSVFGKAEELLENCAPAKADEQDIQRAFFMDITEIKRRRRKNAQVLLEAYEDIALFPKMGENDCPLFVPVIVPHGKRDELRKFLISREIYCPVHWPVSKYHTIDGKSMEIYENELSLVCDQRYTERDMERLVETVKTFWKE